MTLTVPLPQALAMALAATLLAGCGVNERDPHRFEGLARDVAAIPLTAEPAAPPAPRPAPRAEPRPSEQAGLRPLKVELLTPHELWDARDGLVGKAARAAAPALPFRDPEAPPSVPPPDQPPAPAQDRLIQLGAFAGEASAQAAWTRLRQGPGASALAGLSPVFEPVEVGGRRLVRLKVRADEGRAQALCASLAASDPWCARPTSRTASTGAA